ncbi:MAG: helix-turn-helix transcriptional regulator [Asticcacaulis sp.]
MSKTVFSGAHKHLVRTLKDARKRSGLKQEELAERLGRERTMISLIETGQRRVDVLEFYAIAKALGIEPRELFDELANKLPEKVEI